MEKLYYADYAVDKMAVQAEDGIVENEMVPEVSEQIQQPTRLVYQWVDITDEFSQACSELHLGELLRDSSFTLFEAMSAIEMMDPKMDAGMLCNQTKRKVLNFEQSIKASTVSIKDLKFPKLIGIMDATLACLVTWLEGHSLAQTVFTNLYLHNPYIIEDRYLKAFCICILKTVDIIRDRVNRAGAFEEEDFQLVTYGFKMAAETSDVRAIGMMKEVEEEVNRIIKNTRSKPGTQRDSDTQTEHCLSVAVYNRLKFYRMFLTVLISFSKEKCEGISQAQRLLTQLIELVPQMKKELPLGIQAEEGGVTKTDYPTIMGFEPLVNQRLLPPTFPRYTMIKSREEALDYMENQLLCRLQTVTLITEITSLHNMLEIFTEFSKTCPCVLSRSLLQLLFLPFNKKLFGIYSIVDTLKESIRNFIAPVALFPKSSLYNNPQAKEYVDAFLTKAVRPVCTIFQITGHNRARQREKWTHILEELAALQEEADKVDSYLHSQLIKTEPTKVHLACFGTWVLYHTLYVMINYTLAGLELELYATYEYHYIFWYLHEMLYAWMVSTLVRADSFLLEHEAQNGKYYCVPFPQALMGFQLDGRMKKSKFEFDNEEIRYSHRFAPFVHFVTPPMVHYSRYKEMNDLSKYNYERASTEMYGLACKQFHQAKTFYENIPNPNEEVQNLIKIAKTNYVVMKLLLSGHKKDSSDPPEFDFSLSKVCPVIKLN
ncbi:N-alpha-acetyltransferase 35, NatC auxiliary subunit [Octopus bimaculoides]|nr:N-alpha-acetyltransferase 35, NatC auxiliary subunit [Octopus bimaculoides]